MESTRKRKTKAPCSVCGLNPKLCLCSLIPRLNLATQLTLIIHAKELKRTTNTGRLALAVLPNGEMRVRGEKGQALDFSNLLKPDYVPLLLYPAENAKELTCELVSSLPKPIQLLVPDGNWRQAGKVHYRHRELDHVMRVKISSPNLAKKHLRAENSPEGMSTLEAIAKAIAIIENEGAGEKLMDLYRNKLERTLRGRGQSSL